MLRTRRGRAAALLIAGFVAACGQTPPAAAVSPRAAASPSLSASPSTSTTRSPGPSPTPVSADIRLVISDYAHNQVRLARLDATDTATVTGQFDGVVAGQVIVVNGRSVLALSSSGDVRTLGHLAEDPALTGLVGSVAVSPDMSRWIYTTTNQSNWSSTIHLGTPSGETVVATVPSPDGYDFYEPWTWNASGIYMVKQGTGLGGAGPFLEYHFPLAKLDVTSGQITVVSPSCVAEQVLSDGSLLCRSTSGGLEVRSPSGGTHVIQLSTGTSGIDGVFTRLTLAPDQRHMVAARNGAAPAINYQMVAAYLGSSGEAASAFGPLDYVPDAWLPDGRVVADHMCVRVEWGGGPCDTTLNGTYIFSADGSTHSLFYKLAEPSSVVAAV